MARLTGWPPARSEGPPVLVAFLPHSFSRILRQPVRGRRWSSKVAPVRRRRQVFLFRLWLSVGGSRHRVHQRGIGAAEVGPRQACLSQAWPAQATSSEHAQIRIVLRQVTTCVGRIRRATRTPWASGLWKFLSLRWRMFPAALQ